MKKEIVLFYTTCVYLCIDMCTEIVGSQNRALVALELGLWAIVNHRMWELGTQLWSSVRAQGF